MENYDSYSFIYGVYDTEANTYRYFFSCKTDAQAKRQTVAYCVGSNDLFNEPLELHCISKIGPNSGDISTAFSIVCSYKDLDSVVQEHRIKTEKMLNK